MRITHVLIVYFLMGAVMWGGGAITWGETGVGDFILNVNSNQVQGDDQSTGLLGSAVDGIKQTIEFIPGGSHIIALAGLISGLIGLTFWPIGVLTAVNAPLEAIVILGGTPTIAFWGGLLFLIRGTG